MLSEILLVYYAHAYFISLFLDRSQLRNDLKNMEIRITTIPKLLEVLITLAKVTQVLLVLEVSIVFS